MEEKNGRKQRRNIKGSEFRPDISALIFCFVLRALVWTGRIARSRRKEEDSPCILAVFDGNTIHGATPVYFVAALPCKVGLTPVDQVGETRIIRLLLTCPQLATDRTEASVIGSHQWWLL